MEIKYSRKKFDGYTNRFVVRFKVDNNFMNDSIIHIYSNSDSFTELANIINEKKSERVKGFIVEHRATKESDDLNGKFIEEFLKDL